MSLFWISISWTQETCQVAIACFTAFLLLQYQLIVYDAQADFLWIKVINLAEFLFPSCLHLGQNVFTLATRGQIIQYELHGKSGGQVQKIVQMDWDPECGYWSSIHSSQQEDIFWLGTSAGLICKVYLNERKLGLRWRLRCDDVKCWREFILLKWRFFGTHLYHSQILAIESRDLEKSTATESVHEVPLRTVSSVMDNFKCSKNFVAEGDFVLFYNDTELECKSVEQIRSMEKITGWPLTEM